MDEWHVSIGKVRMAKLTLLAGGGSVYVYPDLDGEGVAERVWTQRMVLDVAYPADETMLAALDESRWPEMRAGLLADGIAIVDTRTSEIEDGCE
jgi:hypothetical protein